MLTVSVLLFYHNDIKCVFLGMTNAVSVDNMHKHLEVKTADCCEHV
jgi:hypothetical protein